MAELLPVQKNKRENVKVFTKWGRKKKPKKSPRIQTDGNVSVKYTWAAIGSAQAWFITGPPVIAFKDLPATMMMMNEVDYLHQTNIEMLSLQNRPKMKRFGVHQPQSSVVSTQTAGKKNQVLDEQKAANC